MKDKRFVLWLGLILGLTLAACGGGGGELAVSDVWGRSSPMAAQNGAFYMVIENGTGEDEALTAVQTDACGTVELHEMYMKENDVMGMRQVPGGVIEIPAGETVELQVGGLHVMCLDKQIDFTAGEEIPLTLIFQNAGERPVTADIRDAMEME